MNNTLVKQHELIDLHEQDDGSIAVSGRELHEFLKIGNSYNDWFPRMVEYDFKENHDFYPLKIERVQLEGNRHVTRLVTDHVMTIDMTKIISMIQRNEIRQEQATFQQEVWGVEDRLIAQKEVIE